MGKQGGVWQYKKSRKLVLNDTYLSLSFMEVDVPDKLVPLKEYDSLINDDFEYGCDTFTYAPTNEKIET